MREKRELLRQMFFESEQMYLTMAPKPPGLFFSSALVHFPCPPLRGSDKLQPTVVDTPQFREVMFGRHVYLHSHYSFHFWHLHDHHLGRSLLLVETNLHHGQYHLSLHHCSISVS